MFPPESTDIDDDRYEEMGGAEQFLLTVNARGYGKRSSSFEFRLSGRGGKGIRATDLSKLDEIGPLVAAFPVEVGDQIMLVTDGGKSLRTPVEGIRFVSRVSKGVRVLDIAEGERDRLGRAHLRSGRGGGRRPDAAEGEARAGR